MPRTHVLSRFIQEYKPLGAKFIENYAKTKDSFYSVEEEIPLTGFGRTLAVATFLYDYDCVGNSGTNIGYVIQNGHAETVKIDAGEALPFLDDMANAPGIHHHP